jgi:hypothetical protein
VRHSEANIRWPNRFSRFIGDKPFGLLIADLLGLPVPKATVVGRRVAQLRFGRPTGGGEAWIRTCPTVQVPGKFTTQRGRRDPLESIASEDPNGRSDSIHSCSSRRGGGVLGRIGGYASVGLGNRQTSVRKECLDKVRSGPTTTK